MRQPLCSYVFLSNSFRTRHAESLQKHSALRTPHSALNKFRTNYELFYCSSVSQKIGGRGALRRRGQPKCHLFFLILFLVSTFWGWYKLVQNFADSVKYTFPYFLAFLLKRFVKEWGATTNQANLCLQLHHFCSSPLGSLNWIGSSNLKSLFPPTSLCGINLGNDLTILTASLSRDG